MPSVMQKIVGDPGADRLEDRVGRARRGDVDAGGVRARLADRLGDRVEHRHACRRRAVWPPLPGVTPATTWVPYGEHLAGVELALAAGDALDDAAASRARRGCSCAGAPGRARGRHGLGRRLVEAAGGLEARLVEELGRPPRRWCPRSARPSARRATGWPRASIRPRATSSPRVMPPKMLTRIASTFGSARISRIAAATLSARAPPPMSRKLAGSPPARLTRSIVVIASPAPLTMQPIVPSSWMKLMPWRARLGVGRVLLVGVAQRLEVGVAEQRRVVERDLGVEADETLRGAAGRRPAGRSRAG